jgi:hypothetical protein
MPTTSLCTHAAEIITSPGDAQLSAEFGCDRELFPIHFLRAVEITPIRVDQAEAAVPLGYAMFIP